MRVLFTGFILRLKEPMVKVDLYRVKAPKHPDFLELKDLPRTPIRGFQSIGLLSVISNYILYNKRVANMPFFDGRSLFIAVFGGHEIDDLEDLGVEILLEKKDFSLDIRGHLEIYRRSLSRVINLFLGRYLFAFRDLWLNLSDVVVEDLGTAIDSGVGVSLKSYPVIDFSTYVADGGNDLQVILSVDVSRRIFLYYGNEVLSLYHVIRDLPSVFSNLKRYAVRNPILRDFKRKLFLFENHINKPPSSVRLEDLDCSLQDYYERFYPKIANITKDDVHVLVLKRFLKIHEFYFDSESFEWLFPSKIVFPSVTRENFYWWARELTGLDYKDAKESYNDVVSKKRSPAEHVNALNWVRKSLDKDPVKKIFEDFNVDLSNIVEIIN